jgi:hypothetical protein
MRLLHRQEKSPQSALGIPLALLGGAVLGAAAVLGLEAARNGHLGERIQTMLGGAALGEASQPVTLPVSSERL